jgi:hypothetical protein
MQLQMIDHRRRRGGASFLVAASIIAWLRRLVAVRVSTSFHWSQQADEAEPEAGVGAGLAA